MPPARAWNYDGSDKREERLNQKITEFQHFQSKYFEVRMKTILYYWAEITETAIKHVVLKKSCFIDWTLSQLLYSYVYAILTY